MAENNLVRLRFWIGILAALVLGGGAVVGSIVAYKHDESEFHTRQQEEAGRAARQAQSVGALSVGELAAAGAFIKADGNVSKHEFAIVGQSLVSENILHAAAFVDVVHLNERAAYERQQGFPILERGPGENWSRPSGARSTTRSPTPCRTNRKRRRRRSGSTSAPTRPAPRT